MEHYVDGRLTTESGFWHRLAGIASETQRIRLLEGKKVVIGDTSFHIIDKNSYKAAV